MRYGKIQDMQVRHYNSVASLHFFCKKNLPFLQFMVTVANRLPMQRNKSQTRQPWTFYEQPMLNENASQLHKTLDFVQS